MTNAKQTVELIPAMIQGKWPASSRITRDAAEKLVARGVAYWDASGLKRVFMRSLTARGQAREWRKTMSYDPQLRFGIAVMQLVPVGGRGKRR